MHEIQNKDCWGWIRAYFDKIAWSQTISKDCIKKSKKDLQWLCEIGTIGGCHCLCI